MGDITSEEIDQFVHYLSGEIIAVMMRRDYSQQTNTTIAGRLMVELGARIYMTGMEKSAIEELRDKRVNISQLPAVRDMVEKIATVARKTTDEGMICV